MAIVDDRPMTKARPESSRTRQLDMIERSFGVNCFTTTQAVDIGLRQQQLFRLAASGHVEQVLRGVHRIAGPPLELQARATAAALVLPPGAAIVRSTAAWLHDVDTRSPDERGQPMDVECVVQRGRTPLHRSGIRCYETDLYPWDLMDVAGTPYTTPARTAADLLRWKRPPMGLAAVDALAAKGLVESDDVLAILERWPGERFIAQARQYAAWIEPLTESVAETWLRLRILEAGFPRPTAQIRILDEGGKEVFRLDLGWPDRQIAIEYDGEEFHSSHHDQAADQRRRERLKKEFGWHVVGVRMSEVLGRSLALEEGIGELLGLTPTIRRRLW
jgi:very-short-patch-repair endonuclease